MFMNNFQNEIRRWMLDTFGDKVTRNVSERSCRFLEESLELVQAAGLSKDKAQALVEQVYNKPPGDVAQEAGGVICTLCALANPLGLNLSKCADDENARGWRIQAELRVKSRMPGTAVRGDGHITDMCIGVDHAED